ncbi:hypothetical protein LRS10_21460 [Phenylobacterium sp. J426]|uniref:hypothetical protein n=1 Tax=Phenylobacterium sp. J426 TaxID=2898439 RepID=UPI002150917E|nr:hypothetical protein [Phenylobacterium sp. J426]MCR5876485.1 hypothetical protein [Phenylobacterium sp. J426]
MNFTFSTSRIGRTAYGVDYDLMETLVGLRGEVPGRDWTWDVYGSYGRTDASERTSGLGRCRGLEHPHQRGRRGRLDLPGGFNPFIPAALESTPGQEACFNYLNRTLSEETELTQQIVEGSLQGSLLDLPAGRLRFALSQLPPQHVRL